MVVCKYSFEDVKNLYKEVQLTKGKEAYKYISQVLDKAKEPHKEDFLSRNPEGNHEQSWHNFKGNSFEKLLQHIITELIETLGLKVVNDNELQSNKLPQPLDTVKRKVSINYGKFGMRLPDADLVVYAPKNSQVIAVISSKTSLRERVAQTGYWKFKLLESENTAHIKVYLITPDTDKTLTKMNPANKGRAIAETDLDGTYVLTAEELEESDKVKLFEHFIEDFKQLIAESQ